MRPVFNFNKILYPVNKPLYTTLPERPVRRCVFFEFPDFKNEKKEEVKKEEEEQNTNTKKEEHNDYFTYNPDGWL